MNKFLRCDSQTSPPSVYQSLHNCTFFFSTVYFADLDIPVLTVHQTISDVRGSYYQEKTVFLRCTVNSNPPARFIWKRGDMLIEQSKDNGVDIYEPLYTQVHINILPGVQPLPAVL